MPKLAPRPAPEPPGDPLREALAQAIASRNEAKERSFAAHATVKRAQVNVDAARSRQGLANEAVQQARDRHALVLINAARDDAAAPSDKTLRAVRSEAEIAGDDLEAAEQAFNALTEACAEADAALQHAERDVAEAADAVIAERAPDVLADAEALARSFATWIIELQFLGEVLSRCAEARRRRIFASHETDAALALVKAEPEDTIGKAIEGLLMVHLPAELDWRNHKDVEPWQRAREALKCGSDAPLP